MGINIEDQEKLFKLFGCLKRTQERNTQGIGLGLVISKMITNEFGGAVRMKSKERTGSKFQSSFLLQYDEEGSQSPMIHFEQRTHILGQHIERMKSETWQFSKKKILIVDDDPFNLFALRSLFAMLKLEGCDNRIEIGYNGMEAVEKIKKNLIEAQNSGEEDCSIGLIITDCNMPVMDGFEASKQIRQLLQSKGIRVPTIVALTGHVEDEFKVKAYESGIEEVYSKPLSKEKLASLLISHNFEVELSDKLVKEIRGSLF